MKSVKLFFLSLSFCFLFVVSTFAATGPGKIPTEWGIDFTIPENAQASLGGQNDCYYIYTDEFASLPYITLTVYEGYKDAEELISTYLDNAIKSKYADAKRVAGPKVAVVGEKQCLEIDYSYTLSGKSVLDCRFLLEKNSRIYMFATKEQDGEDSGLFSLLNSILASSTFFTRSASDVDEQPLPSITWEGVVEEVEEDTITGKFVKREELGIEFYIPKGFRSAKLSDAMKERQIIVVYTSDKETLTPSISVRRVHSSEIISFEDYLDELGRLGNGSNILMNGYTNGIRSVIYQQSMSSSLVFGAFINGDVIEISYSPYSYSDDFMMAADLSTCSVRYIEDSPKEKED